MIGYRKLIAALFALLFSTGLLAIHLIDASNWTTFNTFQLGFFFSANTANKLWGKGSETPSKPTV